MTGTTGTNANGANERERASLATDAGLGRGNSAAESREEASRGSGGEAPGVSIEHAVREVIHDIARQDVTSVGRDDDLVAVLGVDSLQGLQILAGVEKRFGIRLRDEELIHMRTIGRIADAVLRQQEARVS